LVIFMITAPLMLNGIKLTLPKTKEVNRINLNTKQVVLSYTRTDEFYLGEEKVLVNELVKSIHNIFALNKVDTLYLRADYGINYGKVARLISHLKKNGVLNIALVTEIEEEK